MSDKPNISSVADAFFHLWQKQVSLQAQSPDKSFEHFLAEGQRIASSLHNTDAVQKDSEPEEDTGDKRDQS